MKDKKEYCRDCIDADVETRLSKRLYNDSTNITLWDQYISDACFKHEYDYNYDGPKGPKALYTYIYEIKSVICLT